MKEYEGNFNGELKIKSIEFSKVLRRKVTKNNKSSGKISLPVDFIDEEVVVLLPIKKSNLKKQKKVTKR